MATGERRRERLLSLRSSLIRVSWLARGSAQPGLGGERDEKPRNLTTEANSANSGAESQAHLQLGVKERMEAMRHLTSRGNREVMEGLRAWSVGRREQAISRAMIDAIDALVGLSDFGEAMGVT